MPIEPIYILYGVIFVTVLLLVEGVYYLFIHSMQVNRRTNRRLSMLNSGMESREVLGLLRRQPVRETQGLGGLVHPVDYLEGLISHAGMSVTPLRVVFIMLVVAFFALMGFQVAYATGRLPHLLSPLYYQVGLSVLLGVLLPIYYFSSKAKERRKKFAEQLPDALDLIVRSLRAGHPINAALGLVCKEMRDPIGTEFGIAVDEMTYGLDLTEALENLNQRIQVEDFNYVVMSISIQHETGGNLAAVLAGLARVIRARARMFLKVRSLSSEGRMSALVLCALPFVVGFVIFTGNPDYYTKFADDPLFLPILAGAVFNMVVGIYMIYRMVNFRV
ncbi:type II secretion system F family protein [Pelagibius marinus]|uniref:type II secretion system F family protein n=1 Tax=Pelagibius marinus TaxID=2762760 RepID=UPI0018729F42|nr:type II secretion system F family protein [Pelagibius marinus]